MRPDALRALLYVPVLLMEMCWLFALIFFVNHQAAGGVLSVMGILAFLPAGFLIFAVLTRLAWPRFVRETAGWLIWAAAMLVAVKLQLYGAWQMWDPGWIVEFLKTVGRVFHGFNPETLIFLGAAVLWWLGRRLAHTRIDFGFSMGEFQFGLIALLLVVFLSNTLDVKMTNPALVSAPFLVFALTAVFLSHAGERTGWSRDLFKGKWHLILVTSIAVIVILGLLMSALVTPDVLNAVVAALKSIWLSIVRLFTFFMNLLPDYKPGKMPELPAGPTLPPGVSESPSAESIPAGLRTVLLVGWYGLVGGLVLLAVWRVSSAILRWLRRRFASGARPEAEPLRGISMSDILRWMRRLVPGLHWLNILRRPRKPAVPREAASIRQVYREFLRWAAGKGFPRHTCQTPHEYLHTIAEQIPAAEDDLRFITEAFVGTRYGSASPASNDLQEIRQRWHKTKKNRFKKRNKRETRWTQ